MSPKDASLGTHDEEEALEKDQAGEDNSPISASDHAAPPEEAVETDQSGKKPVGRSRESKSRPRKPSKADVLGRLAEKNKAIIELNKKYSEKQIEAKDLKDKWLRAVADFENYRKRMRKEWELLQQQTKAEVILEVLNVVDDFERAFSAAGDKEGDEFVEGIRLIYNKLVLSLEKFDISQIEALGQPFDPTYHMAVAQVESEDGEPNHVIEVVQKGYLQGDTVIRPARVIIAK